MAAGSRTPAVRRAHSTLAGAVQSGDNPAVAVVNGAAVGATVQHRASHNIVGWLRGGLLNTAMYSNVCSNVSLF
jgi:hypothetical protein